MDNTKKVKGGFPVDRVSISTRGILPVEQVRDDSCRCDVCVGGAIFVTYSRKIKFLTVEYLPRRTTKQLANALRKVIFLYAHGGFVVRHAMMDMEFEKIKDLVPLAEDTAPERENQGHDL